MRVCPVRATTRWIDSVVIGLSLCPWARPVRDESTLRVVETEAASPRALSVALVEELDVLLRDGEIETSVLVHPRCFTDDFFTFTAWLAEVECWMADEGDLAERFVLVGFHPKHEFADSAGEDDASDWTNRSPYPMVHVLRQQSLTEAIDSHPSTVQLANDNRDALRRLGRRRLEDMVHACTVE